MSNVRRLIAVARGGDAYTASLPVLPTSWGVTRYAGNPVIFTLLAETTEMYNPAGFEATNGDVYAYVKGSARIYAWKSVDAGETFGLQNSGNQVIGPGAAGQWDEDFVVEPMCVYDEANATIHVWYKGYKDGVPAIGHATAADSNPLSFTKDPGNPILTASSAATQLGGGSVTDLSTGSVIKIGSTFHFYLYASDDDGYKIIQGTGSDWNDIGSLETVLTNPGGSFPVVETPEVIALPNGRYAMLYSIGGFQPDARYIRAGSSPDGVTWDFSDTTNILSPTGTDWEEDETYSGHFLKDSMAPFAAPLVDGSGRWRFYYSGLEDSVAETGLAYMVPVF